MKIICSILMLAGLLASGDAGCGSTYVVDVYDFKMTLKVPRIYDNSTSKGSRKYQAQSISGKMYITYDLAGEMYPTIEIDTLTNNKWKINGRNVTYTCTVDGVRCNVIGDNYKGVFKTPTIAFSLDAEPNYNIGEDTEDNSLIVVVSGSGSCKDKKASSCCECGGKYQIIYSLSGNVAGTLGCGCREYGHVSPTRIMGCCGPTCTSEDVAAVFGTWKAKWKSRCYCN